MRPGDLEIRIAGETVVLLPERGVYWPRTETLLVADTHWGKAATMRAAAIPIPGGTTTSDLARLTEVIRGTGARRLVLLGDAIHARQGRAPRTLGAVSEWRRCHPALDILLVRGNHDRGAGDPPGDLGIHCADPPVIEPPFVWRHHPGAAAEGYSLAGHMHPAIKLCGRGKQRVTLRCYWLTPEGGVLPAFGSLTGVALVEPGPQDRVYAIAGEEVIAVTY